VPPGSGGRFQIALYGSKGIVVVHIDQDPQIFHLPDPLWSPGKTGTRWQPLPGAPSSEDPSGLKGTEAANHRIVLDLIRAIETGGESVVSGQEGRSTLEMIFAVHASHLAGARAALPLKDRRHPLAPPG
jgi:predicted dehydrogenase